ncbi:glycoside hydrolase family 19 protein [uncultured Stenotrophomonas sp.]|uniref:glycoside hydrolase family 19 protein n=1 Tax=uncultured Stenotrophomonas sp. TaxID=165438 RepID=UPI00205F30A8|nr:glycoside hydrolase family 19 protein [uncultured Stenotrophomonas sp.]DAI92561.1 MAG TPA: Chitinase A [Caudoviricetes sp.]
MILTAPTIQQAVGCSAAIAAQWAQPLTDACTAFGISTPKRVAAFLAQVGHESAGLTRTVENLNYGAQGMADTWPSRYAVDPKAKPRKPNDLARALERKPAAIGNNAYANRMGNGSEASGDGYRYRGRGPIQNTGRANYAAIRDALRTMGIKGVPDFEAKPETLEQPKWGAMAAATFWDSRNLNRLADAGRFDEITTRINGGQVGAADRRARYARALKVLGA